MRPSKLATVVLAAAISWSAVYASAGKSSRSRAARAAARSASRHEVPSEGIVARATPLEGPFYARLRGWNRYQLFREPTGLSAGEELRVLQGARVELSLPARGILRTESECLFMVRGGELLMDRGVAHVRARDQEPLLLVTPAGEISARAARYSVDVRPSDGATVARVLSGVVRAQPMGDRPAVLAGTGMEVVMLPGATAVAQRSSVPLDVALARFSDTGPGPDFTLGRKPAAKVRTAAPRKPPVRSPDKGADSSTGPDASSEDKPETLKPAAPRMSLGDRMRSLRDPDERIRRYQLLVAQQSASEREEMERAAGAAPGDSLLKDEVLYRKAWLQQRSEKSLARGEMLADSRRRAALFDESQTRDELLAARRTEALGRDLWLQTRQGVAEARAELSQLAARVDDLNAQIAALGTAPAATAQVRALGEQRDAVAGRANRLKDRIEELIEIQ